MDNARTDDNPQADALWCALYRLEAKYWYDVDFNGGCNAAKFYIASGVFAVGENQFEGRDRITAFYAWRRRRGEASTRHVVSNLIVEQQAADRAKAFGVISIYRGTGRPPFRGKSAPALVADLVSEWVREEDGVWRYAAHVLHPIFVGNDVPLSLAVDVRELAAREQTLIASDGTAQDQS